MTVLVTGANGMLGRTFKRVVEQYNKDRHGYIQLIETSKSDCNVIMDITNPTQVDAVINIYKPDVVLHCAALTDVDYCERHPIEAYKVNTLGTMHLAYACNKYNARLVSISTDYVFDGELRCGYNDFPYMENANGGVNEYGRSKFMAENIIREICPNHAIVRTGWLYGYGGNSFVHKMYDIHKSGKSVVDVVNDKFGSPTSAVYVSKMLIEVLNRPYICCTFNMVCEGKASRAEFARKILRLLNSNTIVSEIRTVDLFVDSKIAPIPRPSHTSLHNNLLAMYDLEMPYWADALKEFIDEEFHTEDK